MEMETRKTNNDIEVRSFPGEVRAKGEPEKMVIGGLAARYNTYTSMGWYIEVIKPGFFDEMNTDQTAALKNHDSNMVLARTANNTLSLKVTDEGLEYEANLPDTQIGRDTYEEVRSGLIYQSSFQFTVKEAVWRELDRSELKGLIDETVLDRLSYGGKVEVRELVKGAKLYDVSPVTFPAYQDTTVAKRSYDKTKSEHKPESKPDNDSISRRLKVAEAMNRAIKQY